MEVRELLGPERSLLIINGGSATAVAWKLGRREAGETHVWVCIALTAGVCFGHRAPPTVSGGWVLVANVWQSLLATSSLSSPSQ